MFYCNFRWCILLKYDVLCYDNLLVFSNIGVDVEIAVEIVSIMLLVFRLLILKYEIMWYNNIVLCFDIPFDC